MTGQVSSEPGSQQAASVLKAARVLLPSLCPFWTSAHSQVV